MSPLRWLLAVLFFAVASLHAEDPKTLPQPTTYVSDLANVIDASSKAQLEALCRQVYEKAHATIEVVTVNNLNGQNIDEFTTDLEDHWKVGARGTDKGLILLLAMQEHKDRIEVGYGLEGILNDAKVGDIRRGMHDQLAAQQYGPALYGATQQIATVIAKDANVTLAADQDDTPAQPVHHYHRQQSPVGSIFRILFFLFVLFIIFRGGRGGRGGGLGWFLLGNMLGSSGGGGRSNWGGGGGGSSGGGDFGGGFGGGSGGGGASGDW